MPAHIVVRLTEAAEIAHRVRAAMSTLNDVVNPRGSLVAAGTAACRVARQHLEAQHLPLGRFIERVATHWTVAADSCGGVDSDVRNAKPTKPRE
jgi:hypothetical protein